MRERLRKPLLTKREVRAIPRKVIIEKGNKPDKERVERLTNLLLEHLEDTEDWFGYWLGGKSKGIISGLSYHET
jgi:hypothetical protein